MLTGLVRLVVSSRWGWVVLGVVILAIGGILFGSAHRLNPVEIDSTITSYQEITHSDGTYVRNELKLVNDDHTYTLDKTAFHPTLPDSVFQEGRVSVWVDQGGTQVFAITLYDQNDQNPVKYTTAAYDDPDTALRSNQTVAGLIGVVGLLALAVGLAWPLFPWGRKKKTPQAAMAQGGMGAHRDAGL